MEIILSPETLAQILALGIQESDEFHFPENLWVQVVYEFALAYHDQVLHREHLLKSLTLLYLGQAASFVLDTQHGGPEQVEAAAESLCRRFEAMKPYLRIDGGGEMSDSRDTMVAGFRRRCDADPVGIAEAPGARDVFVD